MGLAVARRGWRSELLGLRGWTGGERFLKHWLPWCPTRMLWGAPKVAGVTGVIDVAGGQPLKKRASGQGFWVGSAAECWTGVRLAEVHCDEQTTGELREMGAGRRRTHQLVAVFAQGAAHAVSVERQRCQVVNAELPQRLVDAPVHHRVHRLLLHIRQVALERPRHPPMRQIHARLQALRGDIVGRQLVQWDDDIRAVRFLCVYTALRREQDLLPCKPPA